MSESIQDQNDEWLDLQIDIVNIITTQYDTVPEIRDDIMRVIKNYISTHYTKKAVAESIQDQKADEPKQAILSHYIAKSEVEEIIGTTIPVKSSRDCENQHQLIEDHHKAIAVNELIYKQRQRLKLRGGK